MARHILFVCTGNTGRSVSAEALARRMIAGRGLPISVSSRGLQVDPRNLTPEPHAVALLAARGIDISTHRARPVAEADVGGATDILTMTEAHQAAVVARFPSAAAKTRTLSDAAGAPHEDIPDAFGGPSAVYARMLARLESLLDSLFGSLVPPNG